MEKRERRPHRDKKEFSHKGKKESHFKSDEESKEGYGKRKRITHFLAIPVDDETIVSSIEQVQNEIYDYYSDRLYDRWFMPSGRFHFSLLMLGLETQEDIDNAKETLQSMESEIKEQIANFKDFKLKLKGVGCFGLGRTGQSKVLYADLEKNKSYDLIAEITDKIIKKFIEKGVVNEKDFDSVRYDAKTNMYKLTYHLTLINTKYQKVDGKMIGFDGKEILDFYNDYEFGEFIPNKITIYQMKVEKGRDRYVTEKNIYI